MNTFLKFEIIKKKIKKFKPMKYLYFIESEITDCIKLYNIEIYIIKLIKD